MESRPRGGRHVRRVGPGGRPRAAVQQPRDRPELDLHHPDERANHLHHQPRRRQREGLQLRLLVLVARRLHRRRERLQHLQGRRAVQVWRRLRRPAGGVRLARRAGARERVGGLQLLPLRVRADGLGQVVLVRRVRREQGDHPAGVREGVRGEGADGERQFTDPGVRVDARDLQREAARPADAAEGAEGASRSATTRSSAPTSRASSAPPSGRTRRSRSASTRAPTRARWPPRR